VERYFLKMRIQLRDWIDLGDMGAIKELVKLGLGASVTAEWIARPEIAEKSLALLPVPGARLKTPGAQVTPGSIPVAVDANAVRAVRIFAIAPPAADRPPNLPVTFTVRDGATSAVAKTVFTSGEFETFATVHRWIALRWNSATPPPWSIREIEVSAAAAVRAHSIRLQVYD